MKKTFFISVLLYPVLIFSQQVSPVITDRPTQSASSSTTPLHHLLVETGYIYEKVSENSEVETYNSTLLRYGILNNMEIRLSADYISTKDAYKTNDTSYTQKANSYGPLYTGTKIYITEEQGACPELSFIAGITLPDLGNNVSQPYIAPSFILAGSYSLTNAISLGFNFGAKWNGTDAPTTGIYSAVTGISLTDKLSGFAEIYGDIPEVLAPSHKADGGFIYLISDNFQIDVSGGIGLNRKASDYFIAAGLSLRIPD